MFRKFQFCMNYVNVSLTSAVDLKVIPLCVNKTGKVTVKVHLSQTDYPEVTQVSGMFNLHQAGTQRATSVTLLAAPHIYFDVKSFFARGNVIRRRCADAVFVCFFCCFFLPQMVWNIWRRWSSSSVSTLRTRAWRGWAQSRVCRRLWTGWRWCHVEMWLIRASSPCTDSGEFVFMVVFLRKLCINDTDLSVFADKKKMNF